MNFWNKYRDIYRPNPVWPEQAIYGGYQWFELREGFWVNRLYEQQIALLWDILKAHEESLIKPLLFSETFQIPFKILNKAGLRLPTFIASKTDLFTDDLGAYNCYLYAPRTTNTEKEIFMAKKFSRILFMDNSDVSMKFAYKLRQRNIDFIFAPFVGELANANDLKRLRLYEKFGLKVYTENAKINHDLVDYSRVLVLPTREDDIREMQLLT